MTVLESGRKRKARAEAGTETGIEAGTETGIEAGTDSVPNRGQLLQLTLINFKSWAGTHCIGPFDEAWTCVIGPNGAGKSNVMDAISFVLGIQAQQLRSAQLKDLVYRHGLEGEEAGNGKGDMDIDEANSDEANSDEDNSDEDNSQDREHAKKAIVIAEYRSRHGDTFQFQRSVTTNGTTEYRVNGRVTTATAYQAILARENILLKARNFLVFQGDVEAVAHRSPKDLTKLIEQISGSDDFKADYDALKAQQATAAEASTYAFHRKRAYAAERRQFEQQREEAHRFQSQTDEKDALVQQHVLWRLFHIDADLDTLTAASTAAHATHTAALTAHRDIEARLAELTARHASHAQTALRDDAACRALRRRRDAARPAVLRVEAKMRYSLDAAQRLSSALTTMTTELGEKEAYKEGLEEQLATMEKTKKAFDEEEAEDTGCVLKGSDINDYNTIKSQVASQLLYQNREQARLAPTLTAATQHRQRLVDARDAAQRRLATLRHEDLPAALAARDRATHVHDEATQRSTAAQAALDAHLAARQKLDTLERDLTERLASVATTLGQARHAERTASRARQADATLATLKRLFKGAVHGRLLDLCTPTQRRYDLPLSLLAGARWDAIVVDARATALACVAYLREQRLPALTFLPLPDLRAATVPASLRNVLAATPGLQGRARPALDVVTCPPPYRRALAYALGASSVVCEDLAAARDLRFTRGVVCKAVTLSGDLIHKTGLMTGGGPPTATARGAVPQGRFEGKAVAALQANRSAYTAQLQELASQRRALHGAGGEEGLRAEWTQWRTRAAKAAEEVNALVRRVGEVEQEIASVKGVLAEHVPLIEKACPYDEPCAEAEMAAVQKKLDALSQARHAIEDDAFAEFCHRVGVPNIRHYEDGLLARTTARQARERDLCQHLSRLRQQLDFERQQVATLQERLRTQRASQQQHADQAKAHNTSLDKLRTDLDALDADLAAKDAAREDQRAAQRALSASLSQLRDSLAASTPGSATERLEKAAKALSQHEASLDRVLEERCDLFRRCKMEDIDIPFADGASLDDLSMDALAALGASSSQEANEASQDARQLVTRLGQLKVDYASLPEDLCATDVDKAMIEAKYNDKIRHLTAELERTAPNLRAIEKLDTVEGQLKDTMKSFDKARRDARDAKDRFLAVKKKRYERFFQAYQHLSASIDKIYKALTRSHHFPLGGTAYLSLEDSEEPYLDGIKYHAMPPMKRFRDMEQLSGGEKTIAALALLFAIHSYRPAPFFVLDEVDAALDNANVAKLANYLSHLSAPTSATTSPCQFIVISLKSSLYERANRLVGVYKDRVSLVSTQESALSTKRRGLGAKKRAYEAAAEEAAAEEGRSGFTSRALSLRLDLYDA